MNRTEQATLPRPRVTELINGSRKAITALVAPSGWGKTWAATEAAEAWPDSVIWITGKSDYADPERFATDLWKQLVMGGHVPRHPVDLRHLEQLSRDLRLGANLLIVVDESEKVHPEAIVALMRGALAADSRYRLLITLRRARYPSNAYPGIPEANINVITTNDLGFTREEVATLAGQNSTALRRYDSHGGWPVAVTGLNEQSADGEGLTGIIRRSLDNLPQDLRQLITRLAPATAWSEALAERVVGAPPADWQRRITQSSLPVHYGGENELRPHNLVREALLNDLKSDPAQYRLSLLAAADHATHRGESRTAIEHLHNAQAWHQLARVLRAHANELAAKQRWQEIVDVTDHLPLGKLPQPHQAHLKHLAGIAHTNLARILRSLNAAGYAGQTRVEPGSRSDPAYLDARGEQLIKRALEFDSSSQIALASRTALALKDDNHLGALEFARTGWDMGPADPTWHLAHGITLVYLTMNVDGPAATANVAREVRRAVRYGDLNATAVHTVRALEYHFVGIKDPNEIEQIRQHLKHNSSDPLTESDRLYVAAVSEAMLKQERVHELLADLDAIRSRLTRAQPRGLQLIHRYRGIALMMDDRVDEGLHALRKARHAARHDALVRSRTTAMYHLALTRAGHIDEAERELAETELPRAPYERADQNLQRAAITRAKGDYERAHALLAEVAPYVEGFTPFGKTVYGTLKVDLHLVDNLDPKEPIARLEAVLAEHPTAAQRFWWLQHKRRLQQQLMEHHPSATRTIMGLTRALLGSRNDPNDQPATH